jgi:hypothetical protein
MHRAARLVIHLVLAAMLLVTLTACRTNTPPLSLAPSQLLVKKAIMLQVSQRQQQLTQTLHALPPQIEISQVKLKQLEPLFINDLATYHVWGTYTLTLKLPEQKLTQQYSSFDVYLQRQKEGKTWRLVLPDPINKETPANWRTYLIR